MQLFSGHFGPPDSISMSGGPGQTKSGEIPSMLNNPDTLKMLCPAFNYMSKIIAEYTFTKF